MDKKNIVDIQKIYMEPDDIYYIIFTSGSTGEPKGVKVTYENLNSCITWLQKITDLKKGVVLNQANFSFDLSVADLYLSLITGSEHYILNTSEILDFNSINKQLLKSNANFAVMTPSFADLLLLDKTFGKSTLPNLQAIIFCGEKLLPNTVTKLYSRFDNIKVINSYGPTECTFAVTSVEITNKMLQDEILPVGKVKEDVNIYILDENKKELIEEKIGEILITGKSVASGYIQKDCNKSFFKYKGENGYLTGDLGYIKNGLLYCIGRNDTQIKYKGYRIDLLDIEENIYKLKYVDKVKILTKNNIDDKVLKIIAFVKLKDNTIKEQINKDLSKILPEYMIPSINILDSFPINNNGKIDNEELRRMINGRKNC